MRKIPRVISHSKYLYYSVVHTPGITPRQAAHIDNLFSVANEIIDLRQILSANEENLLAFPISRQLVTELNTWRYGISRLSSKKFDFLGENREGLAASLTDQFDRFFLQVYAHRNVLQHYQDYVFGDQELARVKQSELDRLGLNMKLEPGSRVEFYDCYVGDLFCSSDRTRKICEVYLGPSLPHRVAVILQAVLMDISRHSALAIQLRRDLTYDELDSASQSGRHALIGDTRTN